MYKKLILIGLIFLILSIFLFVKSTTYSAYQTLNTYGSFASFAISFILIALGSKDRDKAKKAFYKSLPKLDCNLCKESEGMVAQSKNRHGFFLRFCGIILLLTTSLAILFGLFMFFEFQKPTEEVSFPISPLIILIIFPPLFPILLPFVLAEMLGGGANAILLFLGIMAIVGGGLSYLLLSSREVYQCKNCKAIIERG